MMGKPDKDTPSRSHVYEEASGSTISNRILWFVMNMGPSDGFLSPAQRASNWASIGDAGSESTLIGML